MWGWRWIAWAWLLSLRPASAEEDTKTICQQHYRSNASSMVVTFRIDDKGKNIASWQVTSPAGRSLSNRIKLHVIHILGDDTIEAPIYLCVGAIDTTSFTDIDEEKSGAYFMLGTRFSLPVGIVQVDTICWREDQTFPRCNPQFKPMEFLRNLPQYKYSPFEENFWTNMSTERLGAYPRWIWKIEERSNKGSIPAEFFSRLDIPEIEELTILGNDWRRPKKLLNYLPRLERLNFNENNLEIIPTGTFNNTPELQSVILGYNNISVFPSEVKEMKKLSLLDLTNPRGTATLRITDKDVENIPRSTKYIKLENTKIEVNVTTLFLKQDLGFLNLSGCELTNVGDIDLQNVMNMTPYSLDLSSNRFENFPPNFFKKMPDLTDLNLHDNKIKVWDVEFLETNKLSRLAISMNFIENITEESFKNLHQLEDLDLSHNNISVFPLFKGMQALKKLDLSYNNISDLPQWIFIYSPKITHIILSHNRLTKQPLLWSLQIERLDLSHNLLKSFEKGNFTIRDLDLSFSPLIENLEVTNINILNISYSPFRYISPQMWENITQAGKVDLGAGNLECCRFKNETHFKEGDPKKILILGADRELTCSVNKTAPKIILRTFKYNETECNPKAVGKITGGYGLEVILPLSVFGLTIVVIAVVMYVYRFELVYFSHLFRMKKVGAEADEEHYKTCVYDAFVCYSAKNFDWLVETLLPGLEEGGEGYRLCVHDRDFALGAGINRNIIASLDKSRKVIFLLSRDFIASRWCKWEVEMANHKMFEERRNFIILVELERLEHRALPRHLRSLMARTTYLEWPTSEEAAAGGAKWQRRTQTCFRRLRDTLGDSLRMRNGGEEERPFTVLHA